MGVQLDFEWDEAKRDANLAKHGIDFRDAVDLFDGRPIYTFPSRREAEDRYVSVSLVGDQFIAAVWIPRNDIVRIISMRRARDGEKRAHRALFG
jgi:uncharacterized DUF497 family protein